MATITQDLEDLKIGDTLVLPLQFVNDEDGQPIDQTGKRYTFTLKRSASISDDDSDVLVDLTVPAGANATNGIIKFRVEASETINLPQTTFKHEIKQIISSAPEDTIVTLIDGSIKLRH